MSADKPKAIRLMTVGMEPRRKGWAVATGDVGKPGRRCAWRVVGIFKTATAAEALFKKADRRVGRAIFDLANEAIVWIGRDGKPIPAT